MAAGYSGTPLAKKLGIERSGRVLLWGAPASFALGALPPDVRITKSIPKTKGAIDVAVMFMKQRRPLEAGFARVAKTLKPAGGLWIAWPKKSSGVATDLTEDVLREAILPSGYVDNKVCAIDEVWSGLRFVLRKELR